MSNLETVKGAYDAFATGDIPHVLGVLDPNVEWTEAEGTPYAGTYHGPEAVLNGVFVRLGTEWEGFQAKPEDFVDGGDKIVAQGWYEGTFRQSGKSMRAAFAHVWSFKGGKVEKVVQYTDTLKWANAL